MTRVFVFLALAVAAIGVCNGQVMSSSSSSATDSKGVTTSTKTETFADGTTTVTTTVTAPGAAPVTTVKTTGPNGATTTSAGAPSGGGLMGKLGGMLGGGGPKMNAQFPPRMQQPGGVMPPAGGAGGAECGGDMAQFNAAALAKHNELRAVHGAKALTSGPEVVKFAQETAQALAAGTQQSHDLATLRSRGVGENIYASMGTPVDGTTAVVSWYNEVVKGPRSPGYSFSRGGLQSGTGHFTQVVWDGSSELGCGAAKAANGWCHVVCNYRPAGNDLGHVPANVKQGSYPKSEP